MKFFVSSKISLVLFGLCLLSGLDAPLVYADFTFGEPVNLKSVIPFIDPAHQSIDCFSSDGLEMYIESDLDGGQGDWDLWVLRRSSIEEDWGPPENLGPAVNSPDSEFGASISADGLTLFFTSYRPGGYGHNDIYVTTRPTRAAPWGQAVAMEPPVNSSSWEDWPCISADGLELYFPSGRSGGFGPYYDLWVTKRVTTDGTWGEPENLGAVINTAHVERNPRLSPDGRVLFFDDSGTYANVHRPGGYGGDDIWMTMRQTVSDPWQTPLNLGPKVNSSKHELLPCISPDGSTLYFVTYHGGTWDSWLSPIIPIVDFNGDGIVDAADMCIMVDHWGTDEPLCDIGPMPWGDGTVDVQDLIVLAEHLFTYPGAVAYWKLDETEGDIAYDSIGVNDGVLTGVPTWQPTSGMIDGALELDGIGDYVSTPFVLNPADGKFSVFAWIKGSTPGQAVLSQAGGARWLCADPTEGNLMTELKGTGQGGAILPSQAVITDGNWHRIGLVWDGSHRTLYVDDVAVAEDARANLEASENGLYIGAGQDLGAGSFWSGLIDDVRIYNVALTPERIAALAR